MQTKIFKIDINDEGKTVFSYLKKMLGDVPISKIEKLFRNKKIELNNQKISNKKILLNRNDTLKIYNVFSLHKKITYQLTTQNFKKIYEDSNILVVSKQPGTIVSNDKKSLDQQIWFYLKFKQTDSFVPASIGQLDKATSGLIIYAKNYYTLRNLKTHHNNFIKTYLFKSDLPSSVTTTFKIRHNEKLKKEICSNIGKSTKTIFIVNKFFKKAQILTGRKHQIRASLAKLGYPIYGDKKYGGKPAKRVFLHSFSIKFIGLKSKLKYLNDYEITDNPQW